MQEIIVNDASCVIQYDIGNALMFIGFAGMVIGYIIKGKH
jgi:hypothetical protein